MDNNELVGKEFWKFMPEITFGQIYFDYKHFKITKVFKKSARIEYINDTVNNRLGSVQLENIEKYYFKSLEQGIKWNKGFIKNSIEKYSKDLLGYTKLHDKYQMYKDILYALKKYEIMLNDFSYDNVKQCNKSISKHFKKRARFKEGDSVKTKRGVGNINWVTVSLSKNQFNNNSLVQYGIDLKDGGFTTCNEDDVELAKK